jgi:hypothetical protein
MPFSIRLFPATYTARAFLKLSLALCSGFWLLITLLVLSSGPAYAEWVKIDEIDPYTLYVDPDTIRRKGDLVKMWQVYDFKAVQTGEGARICLATGKANSTAPKSAVGDLRSRTSLAIWEEISRFIATQMKANGNQWHQRVLEKLFGSLRAARNDCVTEFCQKNPRRSIPAMP